MSHSKNKINSSVKPLYLVLLSGLLLQGCKQDLFDAGKVKAVYQDRFPVADVDPRQDWSMTKKVNVSISVFEDRNTLYTVRIYTSNPLTLNSDAQLLAEGSVMSHSAAFITSMDCPNILSDVYVTCSDARNRTSMKRVAIEGETLCMKFGADESSTRAAQTRAKATEEYTPTLSDEQLSAMLAQAEEVTTSTNYRNGGVYKIAAGKVFEGTIDQGGLSNSNPAIILIQGNWTPKASALKANTGFVFCVMKGGRITLPAESFWEITNASWLQVFRGGEVQANEIKFSNASNGQPNYNAGSVKANKITMTGGSGSFFNYGEFQVEELDFESSRLVNHRDAIIGKSNANSTIKNACYLNIETLQGSLSIDESCVAMVGNVVPYQTHKVELQKNSLMVIKGNADLSGMFFTSSNGKEKALIKIHRIENANGFTSSGNISYEVNDTRNLGQWERKLFDALKNDNGSFTRWDETNIVLPAGDCNGEGYAPKEEGEELPASPMKYTYVFEDNFPMVGDYDFNDVVLDVEPVYHRNPQTNAIQRIQLNLTLAALGATRPLGIGLRLVGVPHTSIKRITTDGDATRFERGHNGANQLFAFDANTHWEDGDRSVVIPITGDAHRVFDFEDNTMINTGGSGKESPVYTYLLDIELNDQTMQEPLFSKENMDFFICYQYRNMQKRMEVHQYEFWKYGATARGTIQQANLDVAGNNTWAVCVPFGFRYPKESINISHTDTPNQSAYPDFIRWARNREDCQDWYLRPVEANVYR